MPCALAYFDEWEKTDAIETLTYFLDSVMSEYIEKVRDIPFMQSSYNFAINQRALGIGVLGWHSYLQSKMIAFETAHNENVIDFYAYLTIDQSETTGRETHREAGLHVDGFQGKRIEPKVECDRSYIVFDCDCPSFWNQSFETVEDMNEGTQNIFHEFDRTKHYSSEIKCVPFNIYFMDCYAVHSANKAENAKRTFCRLSFSVRQFDRLGNSHNHLFDYNWQMFTRDIHSALSN